MDHERWLDGLSEDDYQKYFMSELRKQAILALHQEVDWETFHINWPGQEESEFQRCFRW